MRFQLIKLVSLAIALGMLNGCATDKLGFGSKKASIGDVNQFYGEDITPEQEKNLLATSIVYFDFDQYGLNDSDRLVVLAHAKKLLENPRLQVRVEGHTDNRGSRGYNLGLGERRAKALTSIFAMKGVEEARVHVVSYGKEKPAALGDNEEAWHLNRRAEIVYEGR
jgi:peptidoglycan-associated lipoprotein